MLTFGFYFFGKEHYPLVRTDGHVFLRTGPVSHKQNNLCARGSLHPEHPAVWGVRRLKDEGRARALTSSSSPSFLPHGVLQEPGGRGVRIAPDSHKRPSRLLLRCRPAQGVVLGPLPSELPPVCNEIGTESEGKQLETGAVLWQLYGLL